MDILGTLGIIIGLIAIVYLTTKGFNAIVAAPVAAMLVIVLNRMPFFASLVGTEGSYIASMAGFLVTNFAVFFLGSILAKYMEKTGATVTIANSILNLVGAENPYSVMVALFFVSALLTYGGVSMFVVTFALIPMARPLFKRLNLSWNLVTVPIFAGMATFTLSMLPGTPASSNFIPSNALGTPLTAAPVIGIIVSLIVIVYVLIYMKYALNKSLKNGETYEKMGLSTDDNVELSTNNLPNIWVSLAPLVSLIAIIIVFSHVANIVLIALTVAILMAAVLMNKQLESQKTTLNDGAVGSVMPTLSTAFTVAFGATLTSAPAFLAIQQSILNIPGNPLISLAVATVLLSFVTGSSVGTVGIVMNSFAKTYLEMGVPAVLIHRISAIAGGVFGVMPHTGLVIVYNNVAKLDLKSSFKYQFMTVNVGHFIALIVSLILSGILY